MEDYRRTPERKNRKGRQAEKWIDGVRRSMELIGLHDEDALGKQWKIRIKITLFFLVEENYSINDTPITKKALIYLKKST